MKKKELIYFLTSTSLILLITYSGVLYNFYVHPTEIIDDYGNKEILLFGDLKYLFKIINCHNLGFNVYSENDCYQDSYGSFIYGPIILIFPSIEKNLSDFVVDYFIAPIMISLFVYLNIKILKPDNFLKYSLITLILFNPTTFFLYEKLNIDILIYIFLLTLVYYTKYNIIKFIIIFILSLTKFYPAILSLLFLITEKISIKNIVNFILFIILFLSFIFIFRENLNNVIGTLDYVSQSLRYSFSLNTLTKILIHLTNFENQYIIKIILILINIMTAFFIYIFYLKKSLIKNKINFNLDTYMFILSSSLSISIYLLFGNNFYREIFLIGVIPYILNNYKITFFRLVLYIFIFKYVYLLIFFPYYYSADLNFNIYAQMLIGIKSTIDYVFISILISILLIFLKYYFNYYLKFFKKYLLKFR